MILKLLILSISVFSSEGGSSCKEVMSEHRYTILFNKPRVLYDRKNGYVYKVVGKSSFADEAENMEFANWLFGKFRTKYLKVNVPLDSLTLEQFLSIHPRTTLPQSFTDDLKRTSSDGLGIKIVKYKYLDGLNLLEDSGSKEEIPQVKRESSLRLIESTFNELSALVEWVTRNEVEYDGVRVRARAEFDQESYSLFDSDSLMAGAFWMFIIEIDGVDLYLDHTSSNFIYDTDGLKAYLIDPW